MKSNRIGIALLTCVVGVGLVCMASEGPTQSTPVPENPFPTNAVPPDADILIIDGNIVQDIETDPHILFVTYPNGFYIVEETTDLGTTNAWKLISYTNAGPLVPSTFRVSVDISETNKFWRVTRTQ